MQKKSYTPPTVTQHGNAVEQTNGTSGRMWEMVGVKSLESKD